MLSKKSKKRPDELSVALATWHNAMRRFDTACGEEVQFVAFIILIIAAKGGIEYAGDRYNNIYYRTVCYLLDIQNF